MSTHPPVPPIRRETAMRKLRMAEDGWNSPDPEKIALVYTDNPLSHCKLERRSVGSQTEFIAFRRQALLGRYIGVRHIRAGNSTAGVRVSEGKVNALAKRVFEKS